MNRHPVIGANIIAHVAKLAPELPIIRHHHEWYNGSGYPDRLMGDEIPKLARVLHVADAFEAMTAARPYRMHAAVHGAGDRGAAQVRGRPVRPGDGGCLHAHDVGQGRTGRRSARERGRSRCSPRQRRAWFRRPLRTAPPRTRPDRSGVLIAGLLIGLTAGFAAGGRMDNLIAIRLRWPLLIFAALALRLGTEAALARDVGVVEIAPGAAARRGVRRARDRAVGEPNAARHEPRAGRDRAQRHRDPRERRLHAGLGAEPHGRGPRPGGRPLADPRDPAGEPGPQLLPLGGPAGRRDPGPAAVRSQRPVDRRRDPGRRPRVLPVRRPRASPGRDQAGRSEPTASSRASRWSWPGRRPATRAGGVRASTGLAASRVGASRPGTADDPGWLRRGPGVPDADVVGRRTAPAPPGRPSRGRDPGAPSSVRSAGRQRVVLRAADGTGHQPPRRPPPPGRAGRAGLRDHELGDRGRPDLRGGDAAEPPVRTGRGRPRRPLGPEARPDRERRDSRRDRAAHPGRRQRERRARLPARLPADDRLDLLPAGADGRDPEGGPRGRARDGERGDVARTRPWPTSSATRWRVSSSRSSGTRAAAGVLARRRVVRRVGAAGGRGGDPAGGPLGRVGRPRPRAGRASATTSSPAGDSFAASPSCWPTRCRRSPDS